MIIGSKGVEKIIELELSDKEKMTLKSVESVKELFEAQQKLTKL